MVASHFVCERRDWCGPMVDWADLIGLGLGLGLGLVVIRLVHRSVSNHSSRMFGKPHTLDRKWESLSNENGARYEIDYTKNQIRTGVPGRGGQTHIYIGMRCIELRHLDVSTLSTRRIDIMI